MTVDSNRSMTQADLQKLFRGHELNNRAARRERLMQEVAALNKRLQNEGMLLAEILTEADLTAHKAALESMIKQRLSFEKESSSGYWRRLWNALLNR